MLDLRHGSIIHLVIAVLNNYTFGNILEILSSYEEFVPIQLNAETSETNTTYGHYLQTSFLIQTSSKQLHLELQLNRGLLHPDYKESYQSENEAEYLIKNDENCFYHGTVRGQSDAFVSMSTCSGLRGVIFHEDGEKYGIEPLNQDDNNVSSAKHIIYNTKDIAQEKMECGNNETHDNDNFFDLQDKEFRQRVKRSANVEGDLYVAIALVIDKTLYTRLGKNKRLISQRSKEIVNYADALYKTIGVRIGLVMVEIWNERDLINVTVSAGATLKKFQNYVNHDFKRKNYKQDNAQLLTGIDFANYILGMAGVGTVCGSLSSGVCKDLGDAHLIADIMTHELGHNLGFRHNHDKCQCNNTPCVMGTIISADYYAGFSSCAIATWKKKVEGGKANCLKDIPTNLIGSPVCGNGFPEVGEECDCGTEVDCKRSGGDKCCIAKTCKLRSDIQCAKGSCCSRCKFKPKGTLCRDKKNECDLPEYCNGHSGMCVADTYKKDGSPCERNRAYCFNGTCRQVDEQCDAVWKGGGVSASGHCYYVVNAKGKANGNCGKDDKGVFIKCGEENMRCGKLACLYVNELKPHVGKKIAIHNVRYAIGGRIHECKVAEVEPPKGQKDATYVADGTICNAGHMCYNHACRNVSELKFIKSCDTECKNGGVCNNKGNCHCMPGFACPDCNQTGPGGSKDSGQGCLGDELEDKGTVKREKSTSKIALITGLTIAISVTSVSAYLLSIYRPWTSIKYHQISGETPKPPPSESVLPSPTSNHQNIEIEESDSSSASSSSDSDAP